MVSSRYPSPALLLLFVISRNLADIITPRHSFLPLLSSSRSLAPSSFPEGRNFPLARVTFIPDRRTSELVLLLFAPKRNVNVVASFVRSTYERLTRSALLSSGEEKNLRRLHREGRVAAAGRTHGAADGAQ